MEQITDKPQQNAYIERYNRKKLLFKLPMPILVRLVTMIYLLEIKTPTLTTD